MLASRLLFETIRTEDITWPTAPATSAACRALLGKLLERVPERRGHLQELALDPWLSQDGAEPLDLRTVERIRVNAEDLANALTLTDTFSAVYRAKMKFQRRITKVRARSLANVNDVMFLVGEERYTCEACQFSRRGIQKRLLV